MSKLILKKDQMDAETRVHFLNDNAVRRCKALGDVVGLTGLGVHFAEVAPGFDSTEYHFHHNEDECIYVISGTAELQIGDEIHRVAAGDFVGHPAGGEPHVIRNTSDSTFTYLVIGQRLEEDIVDYPNLKKRLNIRGDSSDLVDIDEPDA